MTEEPFITYENVDGSLIYGEYKWVSELEFFDDRDEEIFLIKKTYQLIASEEIVLPDPFPLEEDEE